MTLKYNIPRLMSLLRPLEKIPFPYKTKSVVIPGMVSQVGRFMADFGSGPCVLILI
jgi:hypothetical protein